ncbi:MAG: ATP-dependent DNA ligase [Candidatus Woesearchaeota archaeon]
MLYADLAAIYEKLEKTSKRLEKTYFIAKLLEKTTTTELSRILLLVQGRVFPKWDERKIGMAAKLVIKSISVATGISSEQIEKEWAKTGDLGLVAEAFIKKKKQVTLMTQPLVVKKVMDNLIAISEAEGVGSVDRKVKLLAELLSSAKPLEAKYVVRVVLEDLRVGVGEGALRDALVWAYLPKIKEIFYQCNCGELMPGVKKCLSCGNNIDIKKAKIKKKTIKADSIDEIKKLKQDVIIEAKDPRTLYNQMLETVQEALDLSNDFGIVAQKLAESGLKGIEDISLDPLTPIKVMLYQKAENIENAFERLGKPAAFEYKYDGFRLLLCKKGKEVKLFTRRLEDVTKQFPDVVKLVKEDIAANEFIFDSEVIGIDPKTKRWLPFQQISQRIKRKYNIEEMVQKIPVVVNVFDVIQVEGKSVLKEPFKKRREILKRLIKEIPQKIQLAKQLITNDPNKANAFYKEALSLGNEGIMGKNLDAPYKPGSRVGYGVKIKPIMETLDLAITGAEWGEGKRAKWLSSYTVACQDEDGNIVEIGKVSTGLKEKSEEGTSFEQMTEFLKPLIVSEKGKEVRLKPQIVIEVGYEEIQKSPTYKSGYALRFPRFIKLRDDKPVSEISTIEEIEELFFSQRKKK